MIKSTICWVCGHDCLSYTTLKIHMNIHNLNNMQNPKKWLTEQKRNLQPKRKSKFKNVGERKVIDIINQSLDELFH